MLSKLVLALISIETLIASGWVYYFVISLILLEKYIFDFFQIEHGSSSNTCNEIYAGQAPFSELESKAIRNFLLSDKYASNWLSFLTLHSFGGFWLYNLDPTNPRFTESHFIKIVSIFIFWNKLLFFIFYYN